MTDELKKQESPPTWEKYELGGLDKRGQKIADIYQSCNTFIVYETEALQLVLDGTDGAVEKVRENRKCNELMTEIAHYTSEFPWLKKRYNSCLAQAYAQVLGDHVIDGIASLESTLAGMRECLARKTQVLYLAASTAGLVAALIAYWTSLMFTMTPIYHDIWSSTAMGACGGWVSIFIGLRQIKVDDKMKPAAIVFLGMSRMCYAMIAGVVTYFLILGKVALAFLREDGTSKGYLVATFFGGFSEMFIVNVMKRMGEKEDSKK